MSPRIQKKIEKSACMKNAVNIGASPRRKFRRRQPKDIIIEKWKINVEMEFWHHMTVRFQNSIELEKVSNSAKESPLHGMNDPMNGAKTEEIANCYSNTGHESSKSLMTEQTYDVRHSF